MKRIISGILAFCMLLSMMPVTALAVGMVPVPGEATQVFCVTLSTQRNWANKMEPRSASWKKNTSQSGSMTVRRG